MVWFVLKIFKSFSCAIRKSRPAAQSAAASGCFAHNGRSALYSFVCPVSGVRAPRIRFIRTCAPLNFRNIFRVAFLLSCHIFDCDGLSDACLAGCPCRFCFISNSDIISQNQEFVNVFLRKICDYFLTQLYDCVNFVSLSSAAYLIVTLLICICKHYFGFFEKIFKMFFETFLDANHTDFSSTKQKERCPCRSLIIGKLQRSFM